MKLVKQILFLIIITLVTISFSQCAVTQKLQKAIALEFGEAYSQTWVGGVKGSGSGINLYIPVKTHETDIVLDSVYYKGKKVKLEEANPNLYVGRFSMTTTKPDIVMSNKPYAEYGNKVPEIQQNGPFDLQDDECVLSYTEGKKRKYYKISGIIKKEPIFYPSAPPKKL